MEKKQQQRKVKDLAGKNDAESLVSPPAAFVLHFICGIGLAAAFWVADSTFSIVIVDNPSQTLRLIWVIEAPIVILLYSLHRKNPNQCSYFKAVGRGFLALSVGAAANAFGAIVLGAPAIQYFPRTLNWSLMMSVFTFVPAACIFGSSWADWQRIFAHTKPVGSVDYMICLPAHGAVVGAWFGAWPMPLDWEKPWQEWPVCVSYGAIFGYLVGMVGSFGFVLFHGQRRLVKRD